MNSLDAFHRKQLRLLWKYNWKMKIKNERLYELCNCGPISKDVARYRWNMFGHTLRMDKDAPARKAMYFFFESFYNSKKFRGRPRTTLVSVLNDDIKAAKNVVKLPALDSLQGLENMRWLAEDRTLWKTIVESVCSVV